MPYNVGVSTNGAPRQPEHPPIEDLRLERVLHALSDPVRLSVVRQLAECDEPRACGSFGLSVTKSTLSHHIRVLREAGLIRQRGDGTYRLTSLRRDDLDERFPGLIDLVLREAASPAPAAVAGA